jgi:hypothetical protein
MKRTIFVSVLGLIACLCWNGEADGRGFGGFRGGGFGGGFGGYGGYRGGSFGGYSGYRGGSYYGSRSNGGYSGWRSGGLGESYDRSYTTARGGTINTEGERGAAYGPYGGARAGGTRETSVTTAGGRTYSGSTERGIAVGPYGRRIGGAEHFGTVTGPRGTATHSWESAFAGRRFPTDAGLAHYSTIGRGGVAHSTTYWSHGYMSTHGASVRNGFGYYHTFHPGWWHRYPDCWHPPYWRNWDAWLFMTWAYLSGFYAGLASAPINYDYGNNIAFVENNVYENGTNLGTTQQFAQQATAIADQGQKVDPPPTEEWKAVGVFALVQGDEKTSNNVFQIAMNKDGILRGNYYDGLMDTTTPIYGSVDKKTQRAAWTIGKKNDRVFEAGIYNLTQGEAPLLVHIGDDRTQQMLLVRVEQPKKSP